MKKAIRILVYEKYNGLCAYTGKPLDDKWQVDHMTSKIKYMWNVVYGGIGGYTVEGIQEKAKQVDDISNLMPALWIVNHYKRSLDLEGFRDRMMTFHKRLAKLPKKTSKPATEKRIAYMRQVSDAFDITPDRPFSGKFYFENL